MKAKLKKWQITGRIFSVLLITALLALVITTPAAAGTYIEGDPDATIEDHQRVIDDLFISGQNVLMAGTVEGDMFASGENVVISGTVEGNAFVVGQTVSVIGEIKGALFILGYNLNLDEGAMIDHNVYFGGFSLNAKPGSTIGRSVYGGGYQLILEGTVTLDVTAGVSALEIRGPVGGDVYATVGNPAALPPFIYDIWNSEMPEIEIVDPGHRIDLDMIGGEVDITINPAEAADQEPTTDLQANWTWLLVQWFRRRIGMFVSLLIIGSFFLLTSKKFFLDTYQQAKNQAGKSILWGLLVYILYLPIVLLLLIVLAAIIILLSIATLGTLTGQVLALSTLTFMGFTTMFSIFTSLASRALVGYLVGRWLLSKMTKMNYQGFWSHFVALLFGAFVYAILQFIPLLNFFVTLVIVLIGTGAFFVTIRSGLRKKNAGADASEELVPLKAVAAEARPEEPEPAVPAEEPEDKSEEPEESTEEPETPDTPDEPSESSDSTDSDDGPDLEDVPVE